MTMVNFRMEFTIAPPLVPRLMVIPKVPEAGPGGGGLITLRVFIPKNEQKDRDSMSVQADKQSKLNKDILCGNYGANLSICRMFDGNVDPNEIGIPRSLTEVSRPSQALLIVDSGYTIISWRHAADSFTATLGNTDIEDTSYVPGLSINRQRRLQPGQEIDAVYGRHPQKTVNVGFADGHVTRTKAEDLLVKKTPDGHYQNKFPLWVPDSK